MKCPKCGQPVVKNDLGEYRCTGCRTKFNIRPKAPAPAAPAYLSSCPNCGGPLSPSESGFMQCAGCGKGYCSCGGAISNWTGNSVICTRCRKEYSLARRFEEPAYAAPSAPVEETPAAPDYFAAPSSNIQKCDCGFSLTEERPGKFKCQYCGNVYRKNENGVLVKGSKTADKKGKSDNGKVKSGISSRGIAGTVFFFLIAIMIAVDVLVQYLNYPFIEVVKPYAEPIVAILFPFVFMLFAFVATGVSKFKFSNIGLLLTGFYFFVGFAITFLADNYGFTTINFIAGSEIIPAEIVAVVAQYVNPYIEYACYAYIALGVLGGVFAMVANKYQNYGLRVTYGLFIFIAVAVFAVQFVDVYFENVIATYIAGLFDGIISTYVVPFIAPASYFIAAALLAAVCERSAELK